MTQYDKKQAIEKLESILKEYSDKHPDNTVGLVDIMDEPNRKAVVTKRLSQYLMNKILYVINRSDSEYWLISENDHVLMIIIFYK